MVCIFILRKNECGDNGWLTLCLFLLQPKNDICRGNFDWVTAFQSHSISQKIFGVKTIVMFFRRVLQSLGPVLGHPTSCADHEYIWFYLRQSASEHTLWGMKFRGEILQISKCCKSAIFSSFDLKFCITCPYAHANSP